MRKSAACSEVGRVRNLWGKGSVPGLGRYCREDPRSVHLPDGQSLICQVDIYEGYTQEPTVLPSPDQPHRLATMCVVQATPGIPRRTDLSKNGHLADARSSLLDSLFLYREANVGNVTDNSNKRLRPLVSSVRIKERGEGCCG